MGAQWKAKGKALVADAKGRLFTKLVKEITVAARGGPDPAANAIAGAVLVFSFYVNGSSFLAYAIMAERRKLSTDARGAKSLFFTTGLAAGLATGLCATAFAGA